MSLLDKLFKRKKEQIEEVEKQPAIKDMPLTVMTVKHEQTVFQKYPNGLPLEVLNLIDFKYFGAKLKQEQLLSPSYDRKPIKVEIGDWCGYPRVFLTFKSKTSESYRIVGICRYSVACSTRMNEPVKVMETHPLMIGVWREFAENVMWAWERGYNYALVGPEKNIETYRKLIVDESKIEKLKEIENECQHFCYFKSN